MKQVKELYRLISSFLSRSENIEERKQLFKWFDQQSTGQIPAEQFSTIQKNVKNRLLVEIGVIEKKSNNIKYLRIISTAAAVLIIAFFTYRYWPAAEHIASNKLLASIPPGSEKAIIILADGKQINLDELSPNQRIQVGETILTKDAHGKISYRNASTGKITPQQNTLKTPKGATYELVLADGTLVSLNTDSKLTYPSSFESGDRIVELEGEAYFRVTKTKDHKGFIVKTKNQQTRVLGTKFNINAYSDEEDVRTSLEEGSVIVSKQHSAVKLRPNEQAFSENGKLRSKTINIDQVLSWKSGQFCFDGTNTSEVFKEIARWYDIDVTYNGTSNAGQYSGKIPRNLSLDKLIQLLNYANIQTKAIVGKNNRINLIIT
ncbi:FecR family protein [Sphingobacterium detergens]|uniref:FecR family protein n=1 Tax=Sphingobacterium detergens TaxID=1145106 RepID=A0A420AG84_SPHD1|nr:FecR family protein [Sphingobacterium detergens]RKE43530.1 FecR family protein [Sphingobacterium detergens]